MEHEPGDEVGEVIPVAGRILGTGHAKPLSGPVVDDGAGLGKLALQLLVDRTLDQEGTQNGMMLIFLGIIWSRVDLARGWEVAAVALCIYSAYMNWFATQLSAILGAGRSIAPVASRDHEGTRGQELLIRSLLTSVGVALFSGFPIIMVGLFRA